MSVPSPRRTWPRARTRRPATATIRSPTGRSRTTPSRASATAASHPRATSTASTSRTSSWAGRTSSTSASSSCRCRTPRRRCTWGSSSTRTPAIRSPMPGAARTTSRRHAPRATSSSSTTSRAAATTDPINPGAPRSIGQFRFGEAAINLTDSNILSGCAALGSVYVVTRSSGDSGTATMKDFIKPQQVNINNCGNIIIKKVTDPNPDPTNTSFSFTAGGGLTPTSFSLKNGEQKKFEAINPGSGYSVAETVPTGWDLQSSTCDDGSPVSNIDVSAGETVTCTFTNKARGTIKIKKVTDPSSDTTTSFSFTAGGGLSPSSFSLTNGGTQTFSNVVPGSGYSAAENVPSGWDLTSSSCDDGSPVSNIDVGPGETVTCTFNDRQRGSVSIHKQDDAGNALQGAEFELYVDNAPLGGSPPKGAEDTATGQTCTTNASGNCSISNVVPGQYWIHEKTGVTGYDLAADKNVVVGAGQNVPVTLVDPRNFRIIVVVCQQGANDSLHASSVTVDGVTKTSLASGGGGTLSDSDVCGLGGARYSDKDAGDHPNADVNIP